MTSPQIYRLYDTPAQQLGYAYAEDLSSSLQSVYADDEILDLLDTDDDTDVFPAIAAHAPPPPAPPLPAAPAGAPRPVAPPPPMGRAALPGLPPGWTDKTIKASARSGALRDMPNPDHADEHQHGVKYAGLGAPRAAAAAAREKYRVEMGPTMLRRGLPFDTAEVYKHYRQKPGARMGHAVLGARRTGAAFVPSSDWIRESCIWVCAAGGTDDQPQFYSHVCKIGRFHHSSFTAGSGVLGAGEWIVQKGKLRKVSANSGHYRPPMPHFYRAVLGMTPAFHAETTVFLYDTVADDWVDVPVREFVQSPTGGGRYKTHPDA